MQPSLFFQALNSLLVSFEGENVVSVLKTANRLNVPLQQPTFYSSCLEYARKTPKFVPNSKEFVKNFLALTTSYNEFPCMSKFAKELSDIVLKRDNDDRVKIKAVDGAVTLTCNEPLYADDLDRAQSVECSDANCTLDHSTMPVVLGSPCHPGAPLFLTYKDGVLVTHCCVCRKEAFAVNVSYR